LTKVGRGIAICWGIYGESKLPALVIKTRKEK